MSDFWLNCDSCGRQNVGVTFVNGMRFCAKCYQETFGNTNPFEKELRDKIADLEAKLADSERLAENNKKVALLVSAEHNSKIEKLEQQLAEKQSKIQELNDKLEWKSKWLKITDNMVGQSNQDKILFCIEQLEKLKEKVICGVMDISNDFWDCFVRDGSSYMTSENLYDALEQEFTFQIQELKKELNNKETKPKLIKKTLSITSELNEQAEDLGINFSHILREALKKEIKQLKERK